MREKINVLLVEDDETDASLVRMELERGGFDPQWERVDCEADLRGALEKDWDLIISDFAMPGFNGLRAFEIYQHQRRDIPFIFVSGAIGEERAVDAMRAGAKDYLLKGKLGRLGAAVRRELDDRQNRRSRRLAEAATERERHRLSLAIEASSAGVFELGLNDESSIEYTGAWSQILGWGADELPSRTGALRAWLVENIHPEDLSVATFALRGVLSGAQPRYVAEFRLNHKAGHGVPVAVFARVIGQTELSGPERVAGVLMDLTGRKSLEAQLRQAQKMEAVGQLAGGVAHDFNNLLTAILSFGTFAKEGLPAECSAQDDLDEVLKAAERAQELTTQLLSLSRRTSMAPRVISPNDVVASADKILRRLIGADIVFDSHGGDGVWNVRMDTHELEQVLLNLSVNARDAMPRGGRVSIDTRNVVVDRQFVGLNAPPIPHGDYVVISVTDSGTGMDEATQARIFEPFFTTKEVGRGTGLGLSTCYGIVKQAEGAIEVDSKLGAGTTFRVYLPRSHDAVNSAVAPMEPQDLRGSETILVVEDNEQVRQLVTRALGRLGYSIMEASNGEEALRLFEASERPVDLVVTDVVMPKLGGQQLVARLRSQRPTLRVLFMSGYSPDVVNHSGAWTGEGLHLQKPFTPDVLARKVRLALDSPF